jgi:hypothetical protein
VNKIEIAAGINTFNDCKSLARTLQSLSDYMDRIYVVDGRYPDYKSTKKDKDEYSTDGTVQLLEQYPNVTYIPYFAEQKDKRTRYLKECVYDFLLVIDADEYLTVQSWSTFQDQLQRYILAMPERHRNYAYQIDYQSEPNKKIKLPRLIYNPSRLIYTNHYVLIAEPVDNRMVTSSITIEGITIGTDDLLRPLARLQYDIDYQWQLFRKEGIITEKVFNDTECKQNFANHIIWEVNVWKQQVDKVKPVSRFKAKR